jgi:hypothetical protein
MKIGIRNWGRKQGFCDPRKTEVFLIDEDGKETPLNCVIAVDLHLDGEHIRANMEVLVGKLELCGMEVNDIKEVSGKQD